MEDLKCPKCGAEMVETPKTYRCSENKWDKETQSHSGCDLNIFKDQHRFMDMDLDEQDLSYLLEGGEISAENGNKLVLDLEGQYSTKVIFKPKD